MLAVSRRMKVGFRVDFDLIGGFCKLGLLPGVVNMAGA
jgi:hypothetical protein